MPKLFLLGDSTCAIKEECARPETGWGECFSKYLNPSFELCNMAKNGRSTEMIIHEGIFFDCFEACSSGDYVIIQFGHNETKKEIYILRLRLLLPHMHSSLRWQRPLKR